MEKRYTRHSTSTPDEKPHRGSHGEVRTGEGAREEAEWEEAKWERAAREEAEWTGAKRAAWPPVAS